jgi:hypothetical protein
LDAAVLELELVVCTCLRNACAAVRLFGDRRDALRRRADASALLTGRARPAREKAAASVSRWPARDPEVLASLRDAAGADAGVDALRERVRTAAPKAGTATAAVRDDAATSVTGRPALDAEIGARLRLAVGVVGTHSGLGRIRSESFVRWRRASPIGEASNAAIAEVGARFGSARQEHEDARAQDNGSLEGTLGVELHGVR